MITSHSVNRRLQAITEGECNYIWQPCKTPITSHCSSQCHLTNERPLVDLWESSRNWSRVCTGTSPLHKRVLLWLHQPLPPVRHSKVSGNADRPGSFQVDGATTGTALWSYMQSRDQKRFDIRLKNKLEGTLKCLQNFSWASPIPGKTSYPKAVMCSQRFKISIARKYEETRFM